MIDMHYSIFELVDFPVEALDSLPAEDIRFLWQLTQAFNEHQRATMPAPVTAEQIMRRCLRAFAPHQIH